MKNQWLRRTVCMVLTCSMLTGSVVPATAVEEITIIEETDTYENPEGIDVEIVPPEGAGSGDVLELPAADDLEIVSELPAEDEEEMSSGIGEDPETEAAWSPEQEEGILIQGETDEIADEVILEESDLSADPILAVETMEEETEPETETNATVSFQEYLSMQGIGSESLSKDQIGRFYQEYRRYLSDTGNTGYAVFGYYDATIGNDYLEVVADSSDGRFTIGNRAGNPNYSSDDYEKLLYGHPNPWSSETLLNIDGNDVFFDADSVQASGNVITATMHLSQYDLTVIQTLRFISSGNADFDDTVRISYQVINVGNQARTVGVRIMLDTMLADNDAAPFRIPGVGAQTTIRTFKGSSVPQSYQVYDDLDNPTTLATGYLCRAGERRPDCVMFTNWGSVSGSSWSYVPYDGDYLGDSAVAVVFNPVSLGSSASTEVSTYYGVSVGSSIIGGNSSGNSESVPGDQFMVQVKDSETGDILPGATIKISCGASAASAQTDQDGKAMFQDITLITGMASISVEKEGYQTKTVSYDIKGGAALIVTLKSDQSTLPEITSVILDGKDLLSETVTYIEDANDEIDDAEKTDEIQLRVTSDTDGCVYYLIEDESIIEKNDTGIFTLKTLSKKKGTIIESLTADGNRYIKCVSPEGKSSGKIRFGLKVVLPRVSAKGITKMKFLNTGNSTVAENTFASLFLGDKLTFGMTDLLDLEIEIDDEGKVRVGLNLEKMPQTQKDVAKLREALLKMETRDFKLGKKQPRISFGSVEAKVNIAGYGEGWLEDGAVMIDLNVKASGNVKASHTTNFFWLIPLYITVGAEGEIGVEVKGNIRNQDGFNLNGILPTWYEGKFEPSVSFFLEGGVGTKGIANLGVEGRATLKYSNDFVTGHAFATLGGTATLKGEIWKFEKSLKLAEGSVTLYDSNNRNNSLYCADEENVYALLDRQPFKLEKRGGTSSYRIYNGSDYTIGSSGSEASPILVNAGGTQYKFWIREKNSGDVINSSELVWSKLADGSYTEPAAVEGDGTSDFAPSVAVDSVNKVIYIVWQDTKQAFADATVTVDDMAAAAEINAAVLDYGNEDDIKVYTLTDNGITDTIPAVTVYNGKAAIVWYSTANKALETSEDSIICATYLSKNGIRDSVVSYNLGKDCYVSELSVSSLGAAPVATYSMTAGEGISGLNNEQKTGYVNLKESTTGILGTAEEDQTGAQGGTRFGMLNGENCLFWYQNGNIAYSGSLTGDASWVFEEDNKPENLSQEFYVFSSGSRTFLAWIGSEDSEGYARALYGCVYEEGAFGSVYKIGSLGEGNIASLTGIVQEDGSLELSYQRTSYDSEGNVTGTELVQKTMEEYADVSLKRVEFDDADVEAGEVLPVKLTVQNSGNTTVDAVTVFIGDFEKEYSGLGLKPGDSTEISVTDFKVTENLWGISWYTCSVTCDGDADGSNNYEEFSIGYTALYAEQSSDIMMDNQMYIRIDIINDSSVAAENVGIRILADAKDGAVLYNEQIPRLAGRETRSIYFPRTALEGCRIAYVYLTSDTEQRGENQVYTLVSNSNEGIRYVMTSSFAIEAGTGGTITGTYEQQYDSDTEIVVSAVPDEGYVFDKWEAETENEDDDAGKLADPDAAETTYLMPENPVLLKAYFKVKKDAENVAFVTGEQTIEAGDKVTLIPQVTPADTSDKCLYVSSDESVASVNRRGVVTGRKAGQAVITVTCGAYSDTCIVTVRDVPVTKLRMVYPTLELEGIGAEDTADVLVTPQNATEALTYSSDNPAVAEVDDSGRVTAKGIGSARITVKSASGVTAECEVFVKNPLLGISFREGYADLYRNQSEILTLDFTPADTTDDKTVSWMIYDTDVAQITATDGANVTVTGVGTGTTLLEARVGGLAAYCSLNVKPVAESIQLTSTSLSMVRGTVRSLYYSILPSDATDRVSFVSSDSSVVTVDQWGELRAFKPGTAYITASAALGGVTASCQVTVTESQTDQETVSSLDRFQSIHNYNNFTDKCWTYHVMGAETLTAVFDGKTAVAGGDRIEILDQNNTLLGTYTGTQLAGQTITVNGTDIKVRLYSDGSDTAYGFKVASVSAVFGLKDAVISPIAPVPYTGGEIVPAVTVTLRGAILSAGRDYTVSVQNNVNIGTASVTVTGCGMYSGTVSAAFSIVAPVLNKVSLLKTAKATTKYVKISWTAVKNSSGYYVYRYDNAKKKYVLKATLKGKNKVSYTDKKLQKNKKYKYKIVPYFKKGNAEVTGPGASIETMLAPSAPSIVKTTPGKKSLSVTYKKNTKVNGYELYVSLKKSSGFQKAASAKKSGTTKLTAKKLKSGKYYYVKVRSYVTTKNGKIYSSFSGIKKIRVK